MSEHAKKLFIILEFKKNISSIKYKTNSRGTAMNAQVAEAAGNGITANLACRLMEEFNY